MELTFAVLKYLAVVIAAGSAIWAMLRQPTRDDGSGRRRLTRAGQIAIGLVLVGFFVSVASNYIQQELASRSARDTAAKEAQRTREIILSGTPLRRLALRWTFADLPAGLRDGAASTAPSTTCAAGEGLRDEQRRDAFYPLLSSLASGGWRDAPAVLLVSLDESAASVLPLGMLDLRRPDDLLTPRDWVARLRQVAATVEFRADLEECVDLQARYRIAPKIERPRRCELETSLDFEGNGATMGWDLNPLCIAQGVDRADPSLVTGARLPDRVVLLLLTDMGDLPFAPGNFAQGEHWLPWNDTTKAAQSGDFRDHSRLELVPNGLTEDGAVYDVEFYGRRFMGGQGGGGMFDNNYPFIAMWVGTKRPDSGQGS